MILQALTEYYNALRASGAVIAAPGWGTAKISFALYLLGTGGFSPNRAAEREEDRAGSTGGYIGSPLS